MGVSMEYAWITIAGAFAVWLILATYYALVNGSALRRMEAESERLRDRLEDMSNRHRDRGADVDALIGELAVAKDALWRIEQQRTPGANATVQRMARIADEALQELT